MGHSVILYHYVSFLLSPGEDVALSVKGMVGNATFPSNSWLSCTQQQCTVNKCPGRLLRENDKENCPSNIFTLHKLTSHQDSAVVRVGDTIVLEHRVIMGNGPVIQDVSYFMSCDPSTLVCSLSLECSASVNEFNITSSCQENVLIVRAEGKEVGTPITHKDLIGLEYQSNHNAGITQQCAFGCDPETSVCAKELCVFSHIGNSLSLGDDSNNEAPMCGMDMFLIQKF